MYKHKSVGLSYGFYRDKAGEGEGGSGGTGDDKAGGDKGGAGGETVSKADYDKIVSDFDKTKAELEETRLEVFNEDYLDFIGSKDKGKGKGEGEQKPDLTKDVDLDKLTPKQAYDLAIKNSETHTNTELQKVRDDMSASSKAATKKQVDDFAATHDDFPKYKPLMHGLSTDPKNASLPLEGLYKLAKEHAKGFSVASDEDKARGKRMTGEKPGGSSGTMQQDKKYTADEAVQEAFNEVCPDGEFPSE